MEREKRQTEVHPVLNQEEIEEYLASVAEVEEEDNQDQDAARSSQVPLQRKDTGKRKAEAKAGPSPQAKAARSTNSANEATFDLSNRCQVPHPSVLLYQSILDMHADASSL